MQIRSDHTPKVLAINTKIVKINQCQSIAVRVILKWHLFYPIIGIIVADERVGMGIISSLEFASCGNFSLQENMQPRVKL